MQNKPISTTTFTWINLLNHIMTCGSEHAPQGKLTKELIQRTTKIDMNQPIVLEKSREVSYAFMAAEASWILQGRNDVKYMDQFAPSMKRFSNDGNTYDGAYGPRVIQQLNYAVDCLIKDRDTRQAIISIWTPNPRESKDIPCTLTLQFLIRDRKLICNANMRSSDAWIGFIYDIFNFTMISAYIAIEYNRRVNPHAAIELGDLNLTAGSQHLYEQNWEHANQIISTHADHIEMHDALYFNINQFNAGFELAHYLNIVSHGLRRSEASWMCSLIK